ncbi:MAG: hypothetical protein NUV51_09485 [Sulfuricaulis sp.]|nr:hypothetical protein [Sulfuricaulis sp.]
MKKPVMKLFSGREVDPLVLRPKDICIEDLAHALSLCNRFAGHTSRPISVAQHSVFVSRLCDGTGHELQGLLHDGSEAYLSDIIKWVKATPPFAPYRELEDRVQQVIYEKFSCSTVLAEDVEMADRIMVRFEGQKGYKTFVIDHPNYPPLTPEEIARVGAWGFWSWRQSEEAFLTRFRLLTAR